MKKVILLASFMMCILNVTAQNKLSYQSEVGIGYGFRLENESMDRLYFETIHGVRFNPKLFAGLGVGLESYDDGGATIPVFANIRSYLDNGIIKPYLFANLGYGYGDISGVYVAVGLGFDIDISSNRGVYLNLGYQSQGWANNVDDRGFYGPSNIGAFLLQLGCRF